MPPKQTAAARKTKPARAAKSTPATSLTSQQQVFVDEYLLCWNAAEAARRAKYSSKTAYSQGPRLLRIAEVRQQIDKRLSEMAMGSDEVLARLADHARGDMRDLFTKKRGHMVLDLVRAEKLGKLHLVKKYRLGIDSESVELYDAQAALALIGRHHKLFADVQEHQGQVSLVELTMDQWKAQQKARVQQAAGTLAKFDDELETENA
jgi:phage terminase small subunit